MTDGGMNGPSSIRRGVLAFSLALVAMLGPTIGGAGPVRAQSSLDPASVPSLEDVDVLVRDGRAGPARTALLDWWDREWDSASRADREWALWLRGALTLEPSEAGSSYRRIVVEFPGGRFADQALLRLGFITALRGDTVSAARWFENLERDHPTSPERPRTRAWLDLPEVEAALARGAAQPPAADPFPTGDRPSAPSGAHAVQLGAFSFRDRAEELARRVRERGFDVRIVRVADDDLWRVRSGRFAVESDARSLRDRLADAEFDVVVVTDADREIDGGGLSR